MMNTNLVDVAKGYLSRDVVNKSSSYLGESPEKTQKAFGGAIPSIFAGLIHRASDETTSSEVGNLISSGQTDGRLLDNFGGAFSSPSSADGLVSKGQGLLGGIFGGRLNDAIDGISKSSGVSRGSAGKILALGAPLVTALLGREAKSRGLGPAGVISMLKGQKSFVSSALGGLGLSGLLGGVSGRIGEGYEEVHEKVRKNVPVEPTKVWHRVGAGLPLLLLGALAALGLFLFLRGRPKPVSMQAPKTGEVTITGAEVPKAEAPKVEAPRAEAPRMNAPATEPPAVTAPKGRGAYTDTLVLEEFNSGREGVSAEGRSSLDAIAANMKSHPDSKVKIEGHTDNTGDDDYNIKLSLDRANGVRDMLVARGIDSSRILTEGLGSAKPADTNDTSEGRAKNRRVELSVYTP